MTVHIAMHLVLGIPELLDLVFRFLDDASNAFNARVCLQWSEIALDTLWKDVNDFHRLFGLLAPLRKMDDREDYVLQKPDDYDRPLSVSLNPEIGSASRSTADVFVVYYITLLMQSTHYTTVSSMISPEPEQA